MALFFLRNFICEKLIRGKNYASRYEYFELTIIETKRTGNLDIGIFKIKI